MSDADIVEGDEASLFWDVGKTENRSPGKEHAPEVPDAGGRAGATSRGDWDPRPPLRDTATSLELPIPADAGEELLCAEG